MTKRDAELRLRFGRALRAARRAASLSQDELAERSELSRVFVSEVERGLKSPTLETIAGLASALNLRPYELLLDIEADNPTP